MKRNGIIFILILCTNFLSAQWVQQNPNYPAAEKFNSIFFIDENQGQVVGLCGYGSAGFHNGEFTTDGGNTWGEMLGIPTLSEDIYCITLIDKDKGWLAGPGIYHTENASDPYFGGTWYQQALGTIIYNTIFFVDSTYGWAFGRDHWFSECYFVRTYNGGTNWDAVYVTFFINDFHFFDPVSGFASGRLSWGPNNFGCIFKTNDGGNYWQQDTIFDCSILNSICFIDQQNGWVAGGANGWPPEAGYICHTSDGGNSWIKQLSDTIPPLNAIQFTDELNGWAVGDSGTILHTTDGGENWQFQESNTTLNLNGISFVDSEQGWICGDSCIILHTDNGGIVGTNESIKNQSSITLFPNPAQDYVIVEYYVETPDFSIISIFNIYGQEIRQIQLENEKGGRVEINCNMFRQGIYFVSLQTEKGILTEKLIVR